MVKLLIMLLLSLSCSKPVGIKSKLIKIIEQTTKVEPGLWKIKIINWEKISETKKIPTKEVCSEYNVIFAIELQETCYESKSFLEENVITSQILKTLNPAEKIYTPGKCYTEADVNANLESLKQEASKDIGKKRCISWKHILQGGGCETEIEITAQMVEDNLKKLQVKAKKDFETQTKYLEGEQFIEKTKVELCSSEKD